MSLKFMLDNLEGLDEGVAALYSKHSDGKFYLEVDGAVAKSKVDEFRDNNIALKQQLDKFGEVDLEELARLQAAEKERSGKKEIKAEDVDNLVAERVATMQEDHNKAIDDLTGINAKQSRQLESLLIDSKVRSAATEGKVLASAVEDVLLRAKSVYSLVDGVATPKDDKGNVIYGKNGTDPMPMDEWVGKLSKNAPHLFEGSKGGGAGGGDGHQGKQDTSNMSATQKINAGLEQM